MADRDGRGAKDYVEGWDPRERKPLEKAARNRLMELQKEMTQAGVQVKDDLHQEQKRLALLQHRLNDTNEQYVEQRRKLDELRQKQNVTLSADQQVAIRKTTKVTIDSFLQVRPRREEEKVDVDVHYLPGVETTGFNLHVGGEGAGSRDAKFRVRLNQKVKSLAKQAATYWGLDPEKVFFLDRDGRIVPEDMTLSDIVLPPVAASSSSSSPPVGTGASSSSAPLALEGGAGGRSSRAGSLAVLPEEGPASGALELAGAGGADQLWTVKGRNYNLTLVRACTVVNTENLSRPRGETWNDFTFDLPELERELKETREKHGDPEFAVTKVDMDTIPSLWDLKKTSNMKKALKRKDMMCKVAEFVIFLVYFVLVHFLLFPSYQWSIKMHLASQSIRTSLTRFSNEERRVYGVSSFDEVTRAEELEGWLRGALRRTLVQPGIRRNNLYVIKASTRFFDGTPSDAQPSASWCPAPAPPFNASTPPPDPGNASANATGNATNQTGNISNVSNVSNSTDGPLDGDDSVAPDPGPAGCADDRLRSCLNTRVIEIYADALRSGLQVPECHELYGYNSIESFGKSFDSQNAFSFIKGEVNTYAGGRQIELSTTDEASYDASIESLLPEGGVFKEPAVLFLIYVYTPSLDGVFIFRLLVEHTWSGSFMTTLKFHIIDLNMHKELLYINYVVIILLALVCFSIKVWRSLRPVFQQEREPCSVWLVVALIVPIVMCLGFATFIWRNSVPAQEVLVLDDNLELTGNSVLELSRLQTQDYWNHGINIALILLCQTLLFRYLLLYFPLKVVKPLCTVFLFLVLTLTVMAVFLYLMFSTRFASYRNYFVAIVETVRFAQGSFEDWFRLYETYSTLWTLVMLVGFVLLTLTINNVAAAVMLSHKKERDLVENYSYHPFWASERGRMKNKTDFNPATIGWDFSDRAGEPKQVDPR